MPKFNLYKIEHSKKDELISKFEAVGLTETGQIDDEGYKLRFFFSNEPEKISIWWINTYAEFLNLGDVEEPKNVVHFGALLIYDESVCYAVSLGKSHFYLKNFCDKDFGLNLAERIIDANHLKIKNSKHFKNKKSKTITSYQANSAFDYDSGESMHYVKAKTINESEWGTVASFGTSVQLSLDISAINLVALIKRVERKLSEATILNLPKTDLILDGELIDELDRKLAILISSPASDEMSMDEFSISGVDFIFSDKNDYRFYVRGSRNKSEPMDLSIDNLLKFARDKSLSLVDSINDVRVSIMNEYGKARSEGIKKFLEYIDDDRYCLIDGVWHKFNESYLKYINQEVDKITWHYNADFDILPNVKEDEFNDNLSNNHDYINTHKKSIPLLDARGNRFTVELMDLYKDESIFFVKAGIPQKLNYVIDQSINSLQLLQHNAANLTIDGTSYKVRNICLWIIIDKVRNINLLSDLNSIIFLMKLADWRKRVNDAGYNPAVYVNYRRNLTV